MVQPVYHTRSRRLGALFAHLVAAAAVTTTWLGSTGCDECHQSESTTSIPVPPGTYAAAEPDADGGDAAAYVSYPQRDAGTLDEWRARPCMESCSMLLPYVDEIVSCQPPSRDGQGVWRVRCTYKETSCQSTMSMGSGRRPLGFSRGASSVSALGEFFAVAAELEHASVAAFRILARDLVRLGAPEQLVAAAERAAADEVRHTRTTRALARRHGGHPRAAQVDAAKAPARDAEQVAIENAVEGGVHELYGAVIATWAAEHAVDARTRRAMRVIAADETRHAELALEVAAWLDERLSDAARFRVSRARAAAVASLRVSSDAATPPALEAAGLLPPAPAARRLVAELSTALWTS